MKTCGKCKETKADVSFHKRAASIDGLSACCKRCQWIYDLKRLNDPHRVKMRAQYRATAKGRTRLRVGTEAWAKRNKEKVRAMVAANNALRDGKLQRKTRCSRCHQEHARMQKHHKDYTKPLDVEWLCAPCHYSIHKQERLEIRLHQRN